MKFTPEDFELDFGIEAQERGTDILTEKLAAEIANAKLAEFLSQKEWDWLESERYKKQECGCSKAFENIHCCTFCLACEGNK